MEIRLEVAMEKDAEQIRDLMIAVEGDEAKRWYDGGKRPFIPGYDSIDMQKYHMWDKRYYKILYGNALAGVLLISYTGREHARVDRFYIDPLFQNKGIGSKVIALMEELYPRVKLWTLDTIQKSIRNQIFYKNNGYEKAGEDEDEIYYYKVMEGKDQSSETPCITGDYSNYNLRECNMQDIDVYDVNMKNAKFINTNLAKAIYQNSTLSGTRFTNINMSNSVIADSKMSETEICHVSLSGAYIHDINLGFEENKKPLTIERCELSNSRIVDSDLQNLSIINCNTEGMTIEGILVRDLIKVYKTVLKDNLDSEEALKILNGLNRKDL